MKTVLVLADPMISRIEYVHIKHVIHRDIISDNFLMGLGITVISYSFFILVWP